MDQKKVKEKPIVLILSTGRTGTHFIAAATNKLRGDCVDAWHERLNITAGTRKFYRCYNIDEIQQQSFQEPDIGRMIEDIAKTSINKSYIDTGWTLNSLIPLFINRFGTRVKIVLLLRHPFDSAASHAIKGAYRDEWKGLDAWSKHCFITPKDNVIHKHNDWPNYTVFEKNLWRWVELLCYWEELKTKFPSNIFIEIKSENIFKESVEINKIFELLDIEIATKEEFKLTELEATKNINNDNWALWYGIGKEWKNFWDDVKVQEFAAQYGYDVSKTVILKKLKKYKKKFSPIKRLSYRLRKLLDN